MLRAYVPIGRDTREEYRAGLLDVADENKGHRYGPVRVEYMKMVHLAQTLKSY